MTATGRRALLILFFSLLCAAYLYPGFSPVIDGDLTHVMSDGTDGATWPYLYGTVVEQWNENPAHLLYGAVPAAHLNAPEGMAMWMPWIERWTGLAISKFLPLEHISTGLVAALMIFNALCMYALGRVLGWSRSLSVAIAIAWAFSPFTRGRAQVHGAMASTYHVPLAMLGVLLALRARRLSSLAAAAGCFLLVGMAPHYFVITLAFVSPLVIALGFLAEGKRPDWGSVARLAAAVLPMVALLGWCYFHPLPASYLEAGALAKPPSGETPTGDAHPFLNRFAAHPVDYFTGDVALGSEDWNPLRARLSEKVLAGLGESNPHERANGIRWAVWLLVLGAFALRPRGRRAFLAGIAVFGLFSLWLSLSPDILWPSSGPAYWLYSLVSQIRVPSRAGIFVHFAALLAAAVFFHDGIENRRASSRWRKIAALPGFLPLVMIADFPPAYQPMQISEVRPKLESLTGKDCGAGVYFPYISGDIGMLEDYYFLQEMRGSRCDILNVQWPNARSLRLHRAIGISASRFEAFNTLRPGSTRAIEHLVNCASLSWIVFDARTDYLARAELCRSLGWTMTENRVCQMTGPHAPLKRKPEECL